MTWDQFKYMTREDFTARNEAVVEARQRGLSWRALADQHCLSTWRIKQIVAKAEQPKLDAAT